MTPEIITTFLSGYLHSLREETRDEKSGAKYGFDHIILKLAEADNLVPLRLAFHRGGRDGAPKPKKEHEYGEDLKVISRDGTKLTVFVLKDEALTYKNWTTAGFDKDVRLAVAQDLSLPELRAVCEVRIVIAYNKDDEARGVEAFERFIKSLATTVGDSAKLVFERWNLSVLTEKVKEKLIGSPALLPEQFFRKFSYLCWQVEDFSHGSDQWREVLIPDWREFLACVLGNTAGEKDVRLVSIALIVLHGHGKKEPSWETGWIEIMEWAMLALWSAERKTKKEGMSVAVHTLWISFYLTELQRYYDRNALLLATEDSLSCDHLGELNEAISSHHAYWHLARLGILGSSLLNMERVVSKESKLAREGIIKLYLEVLTILVGLINANPACRRPLLDIHHIEIFLVWLLLTVSERNEEIIRIFSDIHERLVLRRQGSAGLRLIYQGNSWPGLLEFMGSGEEPDPSFGKSSYLLQMLIEICVCKLGVDGEDLAWAFYQHLILGLADGGESLHFPEKVELQSWVPPVAWVDKVLQGTVAHQGICVTVSYGGMKPPDKRTFPSKVRDFIETMRASHPPEPVEGIPFGAIVLACVVHQSPLPPEFWRAVMVNSCTEKPKAIKKKRLSTKKK